VGQGDDLAVATDPEWTGRVPLMCMRDDGIETAKGYVIGYTGEHESIEATQVCPEPSFLVRDPTETWGHHSYLVEPCGVELFNSKLAADPAVPAATPKTIAAKVLTEDADTPRKVSKRRRNIRSNAPRLESAHEKLACHRGYNSAARTHSAGYDADDGRRLAQRKLV
jgi:hypothetical protein